MPRTFKIIVYDPMKQEKARARISVNMSISDVVDEIKRHFSSRAESARSSSSLNPPN